MEEDVEINNVDAKELQKNRGRLSGNQTTTLRLFEDKNGLKFVEKEIRSNKSMLNAKNQVQVMKKLKSPYIVPLLKPKRNKSTVEKFYIYMFYYENGDLENYLLSNQISWKKARSASFRIFSELLEGMLVINSKFYIHRDLKLQNILIDSKNSIKITDFGTAIQTLSKADEKIGTIGYMAPEVYLEEEYTNKADVWSFGIICYQLFCQKNGKNLRYPYGSIVNFHNLLKGIKSTENKAEKRLLFQNIKFNLIFDKEIPEPLQTLILKTTEQDPQKRFSWLQIGQHLNSAFRNHPQLDLLMNHHQTLYGLKGQYEKIEGIKKKIQKDQKRINFLIEEMYKPILDKIGQDIKKKQQDYIQTSTFFCLLFFKIKDIYNEFKKQQIISLVNRYIDQISNFERGGVSNHIANMNLYLRFNGKEAIQNNRQLLDENYFRGLLIDVSPSLYANHQNLLKEYNDLN